MKKHGIEFSPDGRDSLPFTIKGQLTSGVYEINFYGRKLDNGVHLCLGGHVATNFIPYEGNEHLLGQKVKDNK